VSIGQSPADRANTKHGVPPAVRFYSASIGLCAPIVWGTIMSEPATERWLTYAEIGELFGITSSAARMLAKRRGWPRRTPNMYGDRARVLVPDDAVVQPRAASSDEHTAQVIGSDQPSANGHDQVRERAIERAITALCEQLEHERRRADDAVAVERALRGALDDAVAAERIASQEATALRAELDRRREWSRWRGLRWALGRRG
jgi:hypothetical protein